MKNNRRKVRFKVAEVFHFSRCLGIDKVPERGNNPLGMECWHFYCESIDIAATATGRTAAGRYWSKSKSMKKMRKKQREKRERSECEARMFLSNGDLNRLGSIDDDGQGGGALGGPAGGRHSLEDGQRAALCASTPKPLARRETDEAEWASERDETTDEAVEAEETDGEEDNESQQSIMSIDYTSSSLQPLNPIQRKRCLEGAGVDTEKGMRDIAPAHGHLSKLREDRKQVGCKCATGGRCDAGRCSCSSEGIPCQSDGNRFPCKCGDKCTNKFGKRNYSYGKIKFHYEHTLNRGDSSKIDLEILSTVNGDCGICEKLSDDIWKNNSETQKHQTRSRKRAGEDNLETIKLFKPTPNEEILTNGTNNTNKDVNVLTELPAVFGVQDKANGKEELKMSTDMTLINVPIVTKKTSKSIAKNNLNKENIDINAVKFDVPDTPQYTPKTLPLTNCSFSSPLQIQIASASLDGTDSPLTAYHDISYNNSSSSFSSDVKFLSPNISDYRQSFLNHESLVNRLLTPSQITCTPVKFNPISLTTNVPDLSFETRVIISDIFSNITQTSQNVFSPNPAEMSIDNSLEAKFDFSEFCRRNSNENGINDPQIPLPGSPSYSCENMESITVTSKLNELNLRKSKSDSSLINVDSKSNSKPNVKCQYTFRPVKNVPNYSESPIINYCKRKSQRSKSGKVVNSFRNKISTTDSVPIDLSNQIIRPCESVNMDLFLENNEISFFDIPLRNNESCNLNDKL